MNTVYTMNTLADISNNVKSYAILSDIDQNIFNSSNTIKTFNYIQNENEKSYTILSTFNPIYCETTSDIFDIKHNQELITQNNECFTYISNMNQQDNMMSIESSLNSFDRKPIQVERNDHLFPTLFRNHIDEPSPTVYYPINNIENFTKIEVSMPRLISINDNESTNQNFSYQNYTNIPKIDNQSPIIVGEKSIESKDNPIKSDQYCIGENIKISFY